MPTSVSPLALRAIHKRDDGTRGGREWIMWAVHSPFAKVVTHPFVAAAIFIVVAALLAARIAAVASDADDYAQAGDLASYRALIAAAWSSVMIAGVEDEKADDGLLVTAHVALGDLDPDAVKVEVILGRVTDDGDPEKLGRCRVELPDFGGLDAGWMACLSAGAGRRPAPRRPVAG